MLTGAVLLVHCAARAPAPAPAAQQPEPPPQPSVAVSTPATATATASTAKTEPPPARAPRRYQVAALGDSLTDPRSGGGKYLDYLRERCPKSRFDGYGKGGDMVNQMRKRFIAAARGGAGYSHVIVFGGVNDVLSDKTAHRTPAKIGADLTAIYGAARGNGAKLVAITVAPWGAFRDYNPERAEATRTVNRWIKEQLVNGAIDFVVESGPVLACGDPERLCPRFAGQFKDGIHFGAEGHAALGAALYEQVFKDCE